MVPEALVRRAWEVSGYTPYDQLCKEGQSTEIVQYSDKELGTEVETIAGDDAMMAWQNVDNEPDPEFDENSDDVSWDIPETGDDEEDDSSAVSSLNLGSDSDSDSDSDNCFRLDADSDSD